MAGEFTVKATNDMGTAECKAMLKVNSKLLDLIEENLKSLTQFLYSAKPSADDLEDAEAFEGDNFMWAVPCDGSPKARNIVIFLGWLCDSMVPVTQPSSHNFELI